MNSFQNVIVNRIVAIYEEIGNSELGKNIGNNAFPIKRTAIMTEDYSKKDYNFLQMIDK
jgi:hypothetical protein